MAKLLLLQAYSRKMLPGTGYKFSVRFLFGHVYGLRKFGIFIMDDDYGSLSCIMIIDGYGSLSCIMIMDDDHGSLSCIIIDHYHGPSSCIVIMDHHHLYKYIIGRGIITTITTIIT